MNTIAQQLVAQLERESIPKQAKLSAYMEVQESLSLRQRAVLDAIGNLGGKATMHKVADQLGVPLNTISGRFSELYKKGYIRPIGYEKEENKVRRTVWVSLCP